MMLSSFPCHYEDAFLFSALWHYMHVIIVSPAPSTAPTPMSKGSTSSSITVHWGTVDCIDLNGDITGYSVRYGVRESAEGDRTVQMAIATSSGGMYSISGLSAATEYTVEVAAVNSAGTGVYSDPITVVTIGKHHCSTWTMNQC